MTEFLVSYLNSATVGQTSLLVTLVCCVGALAGRIKVAGLPLGMSAVFAIGILAGGHGITLNRGAADYILNFGLILFIYTVGLEGGPGFLNALKKDGIRLGAAAVFTILCGWFCSIALMKATGCGVAVASGVYAGAVTNIPSLAASQEVLRNFEGPASPGAITSAAAAAAGYPFGMTLVILLLYGYARLSRVNFAEEEKRYLAENGLSSVRIVNVEVAEGAPYAGRVITEAAGECGAVVSRYRRGDELSVPSAAQVCQPGDILLAVVPQDNAARLEAGFGRPACCDLRMCEGINAATMLVAAKTVEGKTVGELAFNSRHGAVITRVNRAGMEFVADASLKLERGDTVTVVGPASAIETMRAELGNKGEKAVATDVGALFLGVSLGLAIGGIPIPVPGLPLPVKLGVAGGCIIAGILCGHFRRFMGFEFILPQTTNKVLREIGITLFFAIVGLESGYPFFHAVLHGDGVRWMLYAMFVVIVPLALGCVLAHRVLRLNFLKVAGVLSGATTNPPALVWAGTLTATDAPAASAATVYPLTLLLRIISAQVLVMLFK